MTRIIYIIKEMFLNIFRHFGTTVGSLLSLTLLFLLFDIFWVAAGTSERFYEQLVSELQMDVYLSERMPDSAISDLQSQIAEIDGLASISYISKDQAREQLSSQVGVDLLVGYDTLNPLPRSFVLEFDQEHLTLEGMAHMEDRLALLPGVTDISYSWRWLEKAEQIKAVIAQVGLVLGLLIVLTVLLSSTNNIRLMARARAVGFRQMLLMGAGRSFIAVPFLIEGCLLAGIAATAGWVMIMYGYERIVFTQFEIVLPAVREVVGFCAIAALLGLISGWFGIRHEMKET